MKSYHLSLIMRSAPSNIIRDCAARGRWVGSLITQMGQKFKIQQMQLMALLYALLFGHFKNVNILCMVINMSFFFF